MFSRISLRMPCAMAEKIHGAAYPLYVLGQAGAGSYPPWPPTPPFRCCCSSWYGRLLSRSFLKIATSSSSSTKVRYRSHPLRAASPDKALLGKEFRRFLSSPNYMLNCGLGIILLPALGIVLLVKRAALLTALPLMSEDVTGFFAVAAGRLYVCSDRHDRHCRPFGLAGREDTVAAAISAR